MKWRQEETKKEQRSKTRTLANGSERTDSCVTGVMLRRAECSVVLVVTILMDRIWSSLASLFRGSVVFFILFAVGEMDSLYQTKNSLIHSCIWDQLRVEQRLRPSWTSEMAHASRYPLSDILSVSICQLLVSWRRAQNRTIYNFKIGNIINILNSKY